MKPNEIIGQFEIFKYQAQESLCGWLDKELPKLIENWWKFCVLEKVTEEQLRSIRAKNVSTMNGLDFAQLLKVLDRNWFDLSQLHNFSRQHRNYLNELQDARNRWSHKSTIEIHQNPNGISDIDLYRDLDTIRRFMELFHTTKETLDEIQAFMQVIINPTPPIPESITESVSQPVILPAPRINNYNQTVEYIFDPPDELEFKNQLLEKKRAFIKIFYADEHTEIQNWDAMRFTEKSNLRHNINSKKWFRNNYIQQYGVIKAIFSINPF